MSGMLVSQRYGDGYGAVSPVGSRYISPRRVDPQSNVVGKQAPKVVSAEMLKHMTPGTVMVDISIDQGGCFETSQPTNHDKPTFIKDGIVHYCVTNMPGAVPLTATSALNKVTLPFILDLANKGVETALNDDEHLRNGLNIQDGEVKHSAVKEALLADHFQL